MAHMDFLPPLSPVDAPVPILLPPISLRHLPSSFSPLTIIAPTHLTVGTTLQFYPLPSPLDFLFEGREF
ncbi:MAG: hypothetical protein IJU19_04480 [Bacteroidales bacterium]|nr:hypothetical protein [Bacteroidales bacterium]